MQASWRELSPLLLFILSALITPLLPVHAQVLITAAGGFIGDNRPARDAGIGFPESAVMDRAGNLLISDLINQRIRRVSPAGIITTFAGTGIAGDLGDGKPATEAELTFPTGIVLDSTGNLFIAEQGNNKIRRVSTTGIITTIAGTGTPGYSGDGGPAIKAQLSGPYALAFDRQGNLYFSDIFNQVIRKIDNSGIITTVAGNGVRGFNGDDIPAIQASLNFPREVLVDAAGSLYIADTGNHRVRRVTAGIITTFAGNGQPGFSGDGGLATDASIDQPRGLLFDSEKNLLIANSGESRVRRVSART